MCVRRARLLPDGGSFGDSERTKLTDELKSIFESARGAGELCRTPAARDLWHAEYERLSAGRPGLLGAVVGRAEAHVLRLSIVYALLDRASAVDEPHLRAALEVWRYCDDSARFIFGEALGDPVADELLRALRNAGVDGMTRTEIRDLFGRHRSASQVGRALVVLATAGLAAKAETPPTGAPGRPVERWIAVRR